MRTEPTRDVTAYEEPRSALNWLFLTLFLILPAAATLAAAVLMVGVNANVYVVPFAGLLTITTVTGSLVYRCWPTGIQLGEPGITVGAIASSKAAARRPSVYHQAWGVYSCPWTAVRDMRVVTDRTELRRLAKSPDYYTLTNRWGGKFDMTHCNIGVLTAPFMRGALVANIDPSAVTGTTVLPGTGYENYKRGRFSRQVPPRMSATWIVPTRHPAALEQALSQFGS